MLSRDSRTEKKLKALLRAEFRLKQQFEYIDWTEDVLYKEIAALKAGQPVLGLPENSALDFKVVHVPVPDPSPDPASPDAERAEN